MASLFTLWGLLLFFIPVSVSAAGLIGGIGISHLSVYDQRVGPDGLNSGTPHVHAVTDEAYYVLSGRGSVELNDLKRGFRSIDLLPGGIRSVFPGVLHRLVNSDHLTLLVIMGNSSLPEQGDARMYFGRAVDESPQEYARLASLPKTKGLEGALERRDAAIRAYGHLMKLWKSDRAGYQDELKRFLNVDMREAAKLRNEFRDAVKNGTSAKSDLFNLRISNLPKFSDDFPVLLQSLPKDTQLGMCGILRPFASH